MNLSRNPVSRDPVVWRTSLAGIVLALLQAGVLTQTQADAVNGWVTAGATAAAFLIPFVVGLLARRLTAPVELGTPSVKVLYRGRDGVYRAPASTPPAPFVD